MTAAGGAGEKAGDLRVAALVALATLVVTVLVNLPFIASYTTTGDTAPLVLHSTRFFPVSPAEWWTEGFAGYFANFPEATRDLYGFIRPTVNLTFWLESLVAPSPHSRVFLATNYLGHAACAGLVYLVARRIAELGRRRALLAAALFAGSLAALEVFHSPAFRADMLGALLGTAALLLVDGYFRTGRRTSVVLAVILLVLAVLAKETAIAAPLIAAGLILWRSEGPLRARRPGLVILLLSPLVVFALARLGGGGGAYTGLADLPSNVAQTVSSAFFPGGGVFEVLTTLRGRTQSRVEGLRGMMAFALNVVFSLALAGALLRRDRRAALLAGMTLLALGVPMALAPYPRLMYFGQVFALPLFASLLPPLGRQRGVNAERLAAVALLVGPAWLAYRMGAMQPDLVSLNRDARTAGMVLDRVLRDPAVERVYLVNDVAGAYGSLALLQIAAREAGRADVATRVTSSMGRFGEEEDRGSMRVAAEGDGGVRVEVVCEEGCDFSFPGVLPADRARLGVPSVIRYEWVGDRTLAFTIPGRRDFVLVGFDPSAPGVHVLAPGDSAWHRAMPQ